MKFIKENGKGLLLCLVIALPSCLLGLRFPIVGGAVIAIIAGMIINLFIKDWTGLESGIKFTSKKILQWAVVLLGFGLNLNVIAKTGLQSLPIIICTIAVSLIIAFLLHKWMHIPEKISILVGVGSSICGGSAVAATAPVIDADDEEVAQAISVIFFFNVLAAIIFPAFGNLIGFDTTSGEAFGIFAGTAVNDTSSVTAAASTWDSMFDLGSATLDKAVTVKLTRTLAIIPITLVLAVMRTRKEKHKEGSNVSIKSIFPFFILYFIGASVITTITYTIFQDGSAGYQVASTIFSTLKEVSKFFIVLAMAAIGLNTDLVKLIKTGGKPILMGLCCWVGITGVSLVVQHLMHIW